MMGNPVSSEDFLNRQIKTKPLNIPVIDKTRKQRLFVLPKGRLPLDTILVVPIDPPKYSDGGIEYPKKARAAEQALTTVGQVMQIGPLAYTTVTRDGLDFTKAVQAKVGDWVIYTKSAGQITLLRDPEATDQLDCPRFIIMSDADIKFIFDSKEEAERVWSWVR